MIGSARSGMGALVAGLSHAWSPALVVMADTRTGLAGSSDEANCGDGAAAFLVGDDSQGTIIAELVGGAASTAEFLDRWRPVGASSTKQWEERFAETAYAPVIEEAVKDAYQQTGLNPENVDKVVMTGLAARAVRSAAKYVGVAPDKFVDTLDATVGNTGAAHFGILLTAALETAAAGPGDHGRQRRRRLRRGHLPGHRRHRRLPGRQARSQNQVEKGNDGIDYAKFLTWKGMLTREPPRRPDPDRPGGPPMFRSERWKYAFYGSKDRSTGAVHLPPQRVSVKGGAVDDMELVPMADVPATIATFTIDRLAFSMSPPVVVAVVDYDGGGRYPIEMTDVDPAEAKIGMRVEMTFRRLFTADGIHNYFWKARPIR